MTWEREPEKKESENPGYTKKEKKSIIFKSTSKLDGKNCLVKTYL